MSQYSVNDWLSKDERKEVKKWLTSYSKNFAIEHGFSFYKNNFLVRELKETDLLFSICFDFNGSGLIVHTALQPLFLLADNLHFSCGARLTEYPPILPVSLFLFRQRMSEDKQIISWRLENNVLPLFESISSLDDFVQLLLNCDSSPIHCELYLRKAYIIYCYLKLERYLDAQNSINDFIEFMERENNVLKTKLWSPVITPVATILREKNYSEIQRLIAFNLDMMRGRFGLSKHIE